MVNALLSQNKVQNCSMKTGCFISRSHWVIKETFLRGRMFWFLWDARISIGSFNEFIIHQTWIPNLRIFLQIVIAIYFSTGQLSKKLFRSNKRFVFFFNGSNWIKLMEKIRERNWWNGFIICFKFAQLLSQFGPIFLRLKGIKTSSLS